MGNNTNKDNDLQSKIKDCVDEKGRIDYKKLNELKEKWELSRCDIAILGRSGSGKSTLINRLLGVPTKNRHEEAEILREIEDCKHPNHEGCNHQYAPTSSSECTKKAVPYSFPNDNRVRLWDLPGYGTTSYSTIKKYLTELHIQKYHAFLVVSGDNRLFVDMQEMVKYLLQNRKHDLIVWVRTHFDDVPFVMDDPSAEQAERDKIPLHLQALGVPATPKPKIFCVSGKYNPDTEERRHLYDLDRLKAAIINTVPEEIQNHLAAKFQGYSAELLQAKFVTLQKLSALQALLSAGASAGASLLPIAGAAISTVWDIGLVAAFYSHAIEVYGFSSLNELLAKLHASAQIAEGQFGTQVPTLASVMLHAAVELTVVTVAQAAWSLIPIIGIPVSGVLSGSFTIWACHYINSSFHDIALQVIKKIDAQRKIPHCDAQNVFVDT